MKQSDIVTSFVSILATITTIAIFFTFIFLAGGNFSGFLDLGVVDGRTLFLFGVIALIVYRIVPAFFIAKLGRGRRIGYEWSFALCMTLGPILGLIITLCSHRYTKEQHQFAHISK